MNMKTETAPATARAEHPAIADAIELLTQSAQDLSDCLSFDGGSPNWKHESEAKVAYDKDLSTAAALRTAQAEIEAPLLARIKALEVLARTSAEEVIVPHLPRPVAPGLMPLGVAGAGLTPADNFLGALADGHIPTTREIIEVVAAFKAKAKAMTLCSEPDCCYFRQTRSGSCACSQDPDALAADGLHAAALYAERAHRAHERRALQLQMNDQMGFYA